MRTFLFACVHNAGRSQMSAAFFNEMADAERARAIFAGTEPAACVHPAVVEVMREAGIDLPAAKPLKLTEEVARGAEMLITMGCGEECPYVPGLRRLDWVLADPKGRGTDEVRELREEIRKRVAELVAAEGVTRREAMPARS